jgi:hypothetical protein
MPILRPHSERAERKDTRITGLKRERRLCVNSIAATPTPLPTRSNDEDSAHALSNASGMPAGNLNLVQTDRALRLTGAGA